MIFEVLGAWQSLDRKRSKLPIEVLAKRFYKDL